MQKPNCKSPILTGIGFKQGYSIHSNVYLSESYLLDFSFYFAHGRPFDLSEESIKKKKMKDII